MHLAFVVNNYLPHVGGVELHVHSLAVALVKRGHRVSVVTLGEAPGLGYEDGIQVLRLRERLRIGDVFAFPPMGTIRRLRRFLQAQGVDIVSVHTRFFPMTWLGLVVGRATNIPVLLTEHGADHVAAESKLISAAARVVDETVGRWSMRHADALLGVSSDVLSFADRLAEVSGVLYYNGIDLPEAPSDTPARPMHLVFVGRLVEGKGWRTYFDAIGRLRAAGFEVTGAVLGGGPDEQLVRDAAPWGVQVLGRVAPHTVREQLSGAVLVNPSTLPEGFQLTVLEAVAAGGQVVSYPVPSARALAADGAPVRITDPNIDSLAAGLVAMINSPAAPYPPERLAEWSWAARAIQFEQIASSVMTDGIPGPSNTKD